MEGQTEGVWGGASGAEADSHRPMQGCGREREAQGALWTGCQCPGLSGSHSSLEPGAGWAPKPPDFRIPLPNLQVLPPHENTNIFHF